MYILFENCKVFYDLIKRDCSRFNNSTCYYVENSLSQEEQEGVMYAYGKEQDLPVLFATYNDYKEFEAKADIIVESSDNENFSLYIQKNINKDSVENVRKFMNIILSHIE